AGLDRPGQRLGHGAVELAGDPARQRPDQARLVTEVRVEDRLRDAGLGRDLLHRRLRTHPPDGALGRVQQLGTALVAVAPGAAGATGPGRARRGLPAGHRPRGYPSTSPSMAALTRATSSSP